MVKVQRQFNYLILKLNFKIENFGGINPRLNEVIMLLYWWTQENSHRTIIREEGLDPSGTAKAS